MKLVWPPAEKHFEQLTEFQHKVLAKIANREDKTFIVMSGKPGSSDENDRNVIFNEFLRLIELGFFLELDREHPQYSQMSKQFDQQGVVLMMAEMTNRGLWMWEQVPWEKWCN